MSFDRFLAACLLLSSLSTAALAVDVDEAWQGFSSPEILGSGFTHNLHDLPLEGATFYTGPRNWSGDYWASKLGGINYRWNAQRKAGFNTTSPGLQQLRRMTSRQLMELAPSEKYDILLGRYDYPLKTKVASQVSPRAQEWEGICHGWVVATIHHDEPTPKTLQNRDGINVPFGSGDIKALLSYYYAEDQGPARNAGLRCNFGEWTGGKQECDQDLNAGAFHIIIANKLALQNEGLIMDVDRFKEVWNQPVIGFRSRIVAQGGPSRSAARTAVREYRMATELWYVEETDPSWNLQHGTKGQVMAKKDLTYRIEVNARNEIVGGTWESKERPDFIWSKPKATQFSGLFAYMPYLLNDNSRTTRPAARNYENEYRRGEPVNDWEYNYAPGTVVETTTTTYYDDGTEETTVVRETVGHRNYYYNPRTGRYEYRYPRGDER